MAPAQPTPTFLRPRRRDPRRLFFFLFVLFVWCLSFLFHGVCRLPRGRANLAITPMLGFARPTLRNPSGSCRSTLSRQIRLVTTSSPASALLASQLYKETRTLEP